MENQEYNNEFNKFCPYTMVNCRRDCVCCEWSDNVYGYVCKHNAIENVIIKKKLENK